MKIKDVKLDETKKYYVYEWYNKETNYIFYVGKGTGRRASTRAPAARNTYFLNYINKYDCFWRYVKTGLSEKEALELEHKRILELRKTGQCSCNFDDGGINGGRCPGERNGMYGKTHSKEAIEKIKEANKYRNKKEKNSQWGISLRERLGEEGYEHWIETKREQNRGKKNPSYGKTIEERVNEEFAKKFKKGIRYSKVVLINEEQNYFKECATVNEAMGIIKDRENLISSLHSIRTALIYYEKQNRTYKGYKLVLQEKEQKS